MRLLLASGPRGRSPDAELKEEQKENGHNTRKKRKYTVRSDDGERTAKEDQDKEEKRQEDGPRGGEDFFFRTINWEARCGIAGGRGGGRGSGRRMESPAPDKEEEARR